MHGSSTVDHAEVSLKKIFGDLKFAPDGTVLGIPFFTYLQKMACAWRLIFLSTKIFG